MSFRDEVSLSMIATRERQHRERLPYLEKYQTRVLPVAAIYGGNASGKSNLLKAVGFAQRFVVHGSAPEALIPIESFRLDSENGAQPTRFCFEILTNDTIYELSFTLTRKEVLEERLVEVSSTSEKVLYDRQRDKVKLHPSLDKDEFLHFAFRGTRDNQLFLTNSVSQKVENFRPVYAWFKDALEVVTPRSTFLPFEQYLDEGSALNSTINNLLAQLDTGISRLGGETIPFERISIPEDLRLEIEGRLGQGTLVRLQDEESSERFVITPGQGKPVVKKLVTYHRDVDGVEKQFDMQHESDGSRRLIDLLPAFLDVSAIASSKVYFIDELDRSLHTLLTRQLLDGLLSQCHPNSRSQLLFTTHDVLLMDQQLLRRDEMWVTERDATGVSSLQSFSEYKDVRYDKDIRKSYLQGRLGGVPRILMQDSLAPACMEPGEQGSN
jgi:AAA15 family ATPase/GTPase